MMMTSKQKEIVHNALMAQCDMLRERIEYEDMSHGEKMKLELEITEICEINLD